MVNLARPYIGLFPIFLLVALMVAFGLFTAQATREAQISVDHTHSVILDLQLEFQGVLNAETGQRGFLLSETIAT
jgi:CHASE3 domain sensor protein